MNSFRFRQKPLCIVAALILATLAIPAAATAQGFARIDGSIAGAPYTIMRPDSWNGDLVLLVHGSITETFEALAPGFVAQGFGVAFTALPEGLGDGAALRRVPFDTRRVQWKFGAEFGKPGRTYLVGFSRGAHAIQRLLEFTPWKYDGMLSYCGGNGGSALQWDHFFTARILFDYYFPGVMPGTAEAMPPLDLAEFQATLAPRIASAVFANIPAAIEMASVEQFDLAYNDVPELISGIVESLAIHSISVNDLIDAAKGMPFDNSGVYYTGTSNDAALNGAVTRLTSRWWSRFYLHRWYEPKGRLGATPTLLVHTARDGIVPERSNNDKYEALVNMNGGGDYLVRRTIDRAGHCNFTPDEIFGSFVELVIWVEAGFVPAP